MRQDKEIYLIKYLVFLLIISMLSSLSGFAQKKKELPQDLFVGRWAGNITVSMKDYDKKGNFTADGVASIEIFNLSVEEYEEGDVPSEEMVRALGAYQNTANISSKIRNSFTGWAKYTASNKLYDNKGKVVEIWSLKNNSEVIRISGHFFKDNRIYFVSDDAVMVKMEILISPLPPSVISPSLVELPAFSIGNFIVSPEGIKYSINDNGILISDEQHQENYYLNYTGELYKINHLKKSFPKDIKLKEPIETDKKTRIEITMPDIGKFNIAENTKAVFISENLLEIVKGKIHGFIKKLKPKTKFEVKSALCIAGIRGTEYIFNVEDDGTITVIVLDGEIELSDTQNRKTVILKKNQKSIVKAGEMPLEPIEINPAQIDSWWKQ